jgi:hypothetical protein
MTEVEWLTCTDPEPMLAHLPRTVSERKLRLCCCACARAVWHLLPDAQRRRPVEVAERYVEGLASRDELQGAGRDAHLGLPAGSIGWEFEPIVHDLTTWAGPPNAGSFANQVRTMAYWSGPRGYDAASITARYAAREAMRAAQLFIVRCIFGNPFRPALPIDPAWLRWHGGLIPQLAQVAYEEHTLPAGTLDKARLALLADMLIDAGCTDPGILMHLQAGGEHVRGRWVVDLLLTKG